MFEGQQFEHFGYLLPNALRTAIMKKEMLFNDYEAVSSIIDRYNAVIDSLVLSEVRTRTWMRVICQKKKNPCRP